MTGFAGHAMCDGFVKLDVRHIPALYVPCSLFAQCSILPSAMQHWCSAASSVQACLTQRVQRRCRALRVASAIVVAGHVHSQPLVVTRGVFYADFVPELLRGPEPAALWPA